jgi:hypothetical protein
MRGEEDGESDAIILLMKSKKAKELAMLHAE